MEKKPEFGIREYRPEDLPQMEALWETVFGDRPGFIRSFYTLLPRLGTAVVADRNGEIAGMAHSLNCMELRVPDGRIVPCGYLYAVATAEKYRCLGLGARLSRAAEETAKAAGAESFCTSPAEPSLYAWYERIMDLRPALYRRVCTLERSAAPDGPAAVLQKVTAEAYAAAAERALGGQPHMRLSQAGTELLEMLCREYGGGLYLSGGVPAACGRDGDILELYELLCPPEQIPEAAGRLLRSLPEEEGVRAVRYRVPCRPEAEGAEAYLAAKGCRIPPETLRCIVFE